MTEHRGFDLDGEATRAWNGFAARLADQLAGMQDGDAFVVRLAGIVEADAPRLTFTAHGEDIRCGVEVRARPPGGGAGDGTRGDVGLEGSLTGLGWWISPPAPVGQWSSGLLHARRDMARRDADQLAALTVRLLSDVFGALHPVFLRVSGAVGLVDYSASGADAAALPDTATDASPDDGAAFVATEAVDVEELRELVRETIAQELDGEPRLDADGDLMVETSRARVFVRVVDGSPVIEIFARLLHNIDHVDAAPDVVAKINADYSFIKFLFAGDAVLARVHLPATPFVPMQLRRMLATFVEIAEHLPDELVERLGGERDIESSNVVEAAPDGVDAIPPELVTLLAMDPDGVGLDPQVTAEVCGHDRALAWQLLHIASGQEDVWQAAMEKTDDPEQEAKCAEEVAGWKATRLSLVSALELINLRSD